MLRGTYDVRSYALEVSGAVVDVQFVSAFIREVFNRVQHVGMLACLLTCLLAYLLACLLACLLTYCYVL
jgi:hypothetical protein